MSHLISASSFPGKRFRIRIADCIPRSYLHLFHFVRTAGGVTESNARRASTIDIARTAEATASREEGRKTERGRSWVVK
jgi:hypothetical protein